MHPNRTSRFLLPAIAFLAFLAGASLVLLSQEPSRSPLDDTVGGKLVAELKQLDAAHTLEMAKLRDEVRAQLKIVRRARADKSLAADAAAAPGKIATLLGKILDAESAHRAKAEGSVNAKREALVAEMAQQMTEGKDPAPGLMPWLIPTVCGSDSEKTEWGDLFKRVRRDPREDGGEDDEGFD